METALGKLFAGLLIFNTLRIFLPFPTAQNTGASQDESGSQSWNQINYWNNGPDANQDFANQYNAYAYRPDKTGDYLSPYTPGQGAYPPLLSSIVYAAGIAGPSIIAHKTGGSFLTVFGVGVVGWTISKMLQASTMKPHDDYTWAIGDRPEDHNNYVRLMKYWQEVFEITAWGTMGAAFLNTRTIPFPFVDSIAKMVPV